MLTPDSPAFATVCLRSLHLILGTRLMSTPLMFALAALVSLIAVPASRELFNAMRAQSEEEARKRLIPIRVESNRDRRTR
ncbi:hypothetical protein [Caballeronia sp. LZ001]|uniref:hypothetical protein n=2 Tax=Caballeronia TaxID=1827195 RepID=UPI002860A5EB|nr:hypothetical protein [Caballeronia sp. LZ001]MDR5800498.1 hypothetical protein [Caballeronia sp. LZ001]